MVVPQGGVLDAAGMAAAVSKKKRKDEGNYDVVVTDDHASASCWCGSEISGPIRMVEKFLKRHRHENPRNEPAGFRV